MTRLTLICGQACFRVAGMMPTTGAKVKFVSALPGITTSNLSMGAITLCTKVSKIQGKISPGIGLTLDSIN